MADMWLDTRTGDLLVGRAAIDGRIEEAGPDIIPLVDAVLDDSLADPIEKSRKIEGGSDKEAFIAYGKWALQLMESQPDVKRLDSNHLKRLGELGVGPKYSGIRREFGAMWHFREAIGAKPHKSLHKYDDWTTADYVEYARRVASARHRKPLESDYQDWGRKGRGPSIKTIKLHIDVSELNELIGYPNVKNWGEADYIRWGSKLMRANDGLLPNARMVRHLSREKRGPSDKSIQTIFGTVGGFAERVASDYQEKVDKFNSIIGHLDEGARQEVERTAEKVSFVARYEVAYTLSPHIGPKLAVIAAAYSNAPASFVKRLRKMDPSLTPGDIEMHASMQGLFDDIWDFTGNWRNHLRVPEDHIGPVRNYLSDDELAA